MVGSAGVTVPEPIGFKITRWGSDPYSRGGYSYMPVVGPVSELLVSVHSANGVSLSQGFTEEEFHELCRPLGPLVFAGEHVNNTVGNSYL